MIIQQDFYDFICSHVQCEIISQIFIRLFDVMKDYANETVLTKIS